MNMLAESRGVIVTGAAAGIGLAASRLFAERGDHVVLVDADAFKLDIAVRELRDRGFDVEGVAADVSSDSDAQMCTDTCLSRFGRIDVLVNNAGIARRGGIDVMTEGEWDRVLEVNLKGVFLMTRSAVAELRRSPAGAIVNLASVHSFASSSGLAAYAASKGAVLALTRQLAVELGRDGIRVTCVVPSYIATDMTQGITHAGASEPGYRVRADASPLKRWGTAPEVGEAIWFLASSAASFITGSALIVDGGALAQLLPE